MPDLDLLWLLTGILTVVVLLLLLALLLLRIILPRREARSEVQRLELATLLTKSSPVAADTVRLSSIPPDLVADVSLELMQMVRGDEKVRIVEAARRSGVVEVLLDRLTSWSPGIRLGAAEALGDFVDDNVDEQLRAALDDPIATVRLAAAISLASADRAPPLRLLIDKLELGTAECSRFILRLFRDRVIANPEEVAALLEEEGISGTAKRYAAEALAAEADYASVAAIAALVLDADTDPLEVLGYVAALGELAHPGATEAVEHALCDDDWEVRAAAASAAGKIRLLGSVERLTGLLADPHWLVRLSASEALGKLGERGTNALIQVAATASGAAREAATIELAQRKT